MTGTHRIGDEYLNVGGAYEFELRRAGQWRVAGITLHTSFVTGDGMLPERAMARAPCAAEHAAV